MKLRSPGEDRTSLTGGDCIFWSSSVCSCLWGGKAGKRVWTGVSIPLLTIVTHSVRQGKWYSKNARHKKKVVSRNGFPSLTNSCTYVMHRTPVAFATTSSIVCMLEQPPLMSAVQFGVQEQKLQRLDDVYFSVALHCLRLPTCIIIAFIDFAFLWGIGCCLLPAG